MEEAPAPTIKAVRDFLAGTQSPAADHSSD